MGNITGEFCNILDEVNVTPSLKIMVSLNMETETKPTSFRNHHKPPTAAPSVRYRHAYAKVKEWKAKNRVRGVSRHITSEANRGSGKEPA